VAEVKAAPATVVVPPESTAVATVLVLFIATDPPETVRLVTAFELLRLTTPLVTVAVPTLAGAVTVVLPPLAFRAVKAPAVALTVAAPETRALPTAPPLTLIVPPGAMSVPRVPPPMLSRPPVVVAVLTLPPLKLNVPLLTVAEPTLVKALPKLALPPLIVIRPPGMFKAEALAASAPPVFTVKDVGLIEPPLCSVKAAVAGPLPSMVSAPSETGAAGPVTDTLEADGGATNTFVPVVGAAVPVTFVTPRLVNCRPPAW
jgi:hypothetical protein